MRNLVLTGVSILVEGRGGSNDVLVLVAGAIESRSDCDDKGKRFLNEKGKLLPLLELT